MPKFRKKPVIVEAEQWFPWLQIEGVLQPDSDSMTQFAPHVITPNGVVEIKSGDWVVRGEKGNYVYPLEGFEQSYEPVDSEAQIVWTQAYGFNNDPIHNLDPNNHSDSYVARRLNELHP